MNNTPFWKFWDMQSGPVGGMIFGMIFGLLVLLVAYFLFGGF